MKKDGIFTTCVICKKEFYLSPSHRNLKNYCSRACRAIGQSDWQRKDLRQRFYDKVNKTDTCWLWTGAKLRTGYGSIRINKQAKRAHRVAYELEIGPIPEGFLLRHTCDNPLCVNPSHLIPGTHKENINDAIERGLFPIGEKSVLSKLSNSDVLVIKSSLKAGVTGRHLAKLFGVTESCISNIKHNVQRKHG